MIQLTPGQKKALRSTQPATKATPSVKALIALGLMEMYISPVNGLELYRRTPEGIRVGMELHRIESMLYTRDSSGKLKKRR